jgi:hypothetical protein
VRGNHFLINVVSAASLFPFTFCLDLCCCAVYARESFAGDGAPALDHLARDDELFDALLRQGGHGIKVAVVP